METLDVTSRHFLLQVFASLANVMGRHENMPSPVPAQIRDYKMFDVEIKYGLLQVRKFLVKFKAKVSRV